ncbi:MAG: metalloregulator ArsR/SmtB family transcription factor [Balneolaceae bacterium]
MKAGFMNSREFKTKLYEELSRVTKALSNPHRLEILDLLAQSPFPVAYIAEQIHLPVANTSQHLQVLKTSGLVRTERKGKYMYYGLAGEHVFDTWITLRKLGFSLNGEINTLLEDYREKRSKLNTINREELLIKLDRQEIYLIDVRPEEEYRKGHIDQAISFPQRELKDHLDKLPKEREIVAYCRGPLCLMADEAVALLNERGYSAVRLNDGFADWIANDMPVNQPEITN